MTAMLSFGSCCCSKNSLCADHHPRNVLVNWRYKVNLEYGLYMLRKFGDSILDVIVDIPGMDACVDFGYFCYDIMERAWRDSKT